MPVVNVCPYCTSARAVQLGAAVVAPLVLSACYGIPPCEPVQIVDNDGDGFSVDIGGCTIGNDDCDDANPQVNPGAAEVCDDGIDNNCDGVAASVELAEVCNGIDDDCDGVIDEDDVCATTPTGDTGTTATSKAAISAAFTWEAPAPATTCAEAGVSTVTVNLRAQLDEKAAVTREIPCADTATDLRGLPAGAWLIDARAASGDGVRRWESQPKVVDLNTGTSSPVVLELVCSSDQPNGCGP